MSDGPWMMEHGIAACIRITTPDGHEWTAINMGHGIDWIRNHATFRTPGLPTWVINRVRKRFAEVTAIMPLQKRSEYCSHTPFEIKEDEECLVLSDIVVPNSITIEHYSNITPPKTFLTGKHFGFAPPKWLALYCDIEPIVRKSIEAHLVGGHISGLALIRQVAGEHEGKLVAHANSSAIGSYRIGIISSLGRCKLPEPFRTLQELARS